MGFWCNPWCDVSTFRERDVSLYKITKGRLQRPFI
jgi:hypothetical protein